MTPSQQPAQSLEELQALRTTIKQLITDSIERGRAERQPLHIELLHLDAAIIELKTVRPHSKTVIYRPKEATDE